MPYNIKSNNIECPLISIVTVCYNAASFIERTILSVINQSYPNKEYIIIDGGSKDGTINIIKKYENKIDKWISEPDNGIYDAMNKGIDLSTGEWINFMNAGDCFYKDSVLENIFKNPIDENIAFFYSDVYRYSTDHKKMILYKNDRDKGDVNHQGSIYKRNLHFKYGYYLTQKPYSVYDLLFFLSIPSELFMKTNLPIAVVEPGGASDQGRWVLEKAQALLVLFGYQSISDAFFIYWRRTIKKAILNRLWIKRF